MRGVRLSATRAIEIADLPEPRLGDGDVLVGVEKAGICGSDMHVYGGHHPFRKPPVVLGHEVAGRVLASGPGVGGPPAGTAVTVEPQIACGTCASCRADLPHLCRRARRPGNGWNGFFAERIIAPASVLHRLPPDMTFEDGALAEPTAVAVRAVRQADVGLGDAVAVIGLGPIGSLAVSAVIAAGAEVVVASDVKPFNLRFAADLGVQRVLDPTVESLVETVLEATAGDGVDVVIVTASVPQVLLEAIGMVRPGGTVVQVALHDEPIRFDATAAVMKEVAVLSTLTYSSEDFRIALGLVARNVVSAERFVTHTYHYTEADKAFADIANGLEHMKVLLSFDPTVPA